MPVTTNAKDEWFLLGYVFGGKVHHGEEGTVAEESRFMTVSACEVASCIGKGEEAESLGWNQTSLYARPQDLVVQITQEGSAPKVSTAFQSSATS